MSNYTKSTNFATKDNLSPGDPLKIVRGTEIDTEFNNISTAISTKTDNSAAAITGGSITGITDLAIADGGTGASTATAAINNLLPAQTSAANKYLQSDGTNVSWDAVTLSTADITGTLPVANGGTGVTSSTGTGNVVLSTSPTLVTPALGTPSALVGTNITGTASGLTAGNVTTNANLTGAVTSVGNATSLGSFSSANLLGALTDETGTGSAVFATSPTLVTPILGTPTSATLTNATGLPIATGVSGLGTGVATALAVNVGSAGAPVVNGGALGTPSSGTATNLTGLPLTTGVTGTLPTANGGTNLTSFTSGGVVYASSTSALATGSGLQFNGTSLGLAVTPDAWSGAVPRGIQLGSNGALNARSALYATTNAYYNGTNWIYQSTDLASYYIQNAGTHQWYNAPSGTAGNTVTFSEQMRLTTTGLGIGTSSPYTKFDVTSGSTAAPTLGSPTAFAAAFRNAVGGSLYGLGISVQANGNAWLQSQRFDSTATAYDIVLGPLGGNLGIGSTPNTWESTQNKSLSIGLNSSYNGGLSYNNNPNALSLATHAYNTTTAAITGWKYSGASVYAGLYQFNGTNGQHQWFYAPSGTAGNAITFTQAMTLDSAGRLALGSTAILGTSNVASFTNFVGAKGVLAIQNTSASGYSAVELYNTAGSQTGAMGYGNASVAVTGAQDNVYLYSATAISFLSGGTTERARIPSTGGIQSVNSISVGNATPTTSGAGITFPATQSASSNANTLDDYEEGTWTPVLTAATVGDLTVAYTTQLGFYTKIGRLVTVSFNIQTSTFTRTTAAGNTTISGLPFTTSSTAGSFTFGNIAVQGVLKANYTQIGCSPSVNTSNITFPISGPTSNQNLDNLAITDMPSGGLVILRGSVSYIV